MILIRQKPEKKTCTFQIDQELQKEVKKRCKEQKIFFQDAIEFGLKVYLEETKKRSRS